VPLGCDDNKPLTLPLDFLTPGVSPLTIEGRGKGAAPDPGLRHPW
jgi:hypothetical protein